MLIKDSKEEVQRADQRINQEIHSADKKNPRRKFIVLIKESKEELQCADQRIQGGSKWC